MLPADSRPRAKEWKHVGEGLAGVRLAWRWTVIPAVGDPGGGETEAWLHAGARTASSVSIRETTSSLSLTVTPMARASFWTSGTRIHRRHRHEVSGEGHTVMGTAYQQPHACLATKTKGNLPVVSCP